MTQQHNGYLISSSAIPGPPYTTYWTPRGTVLHQRPDNSVVELARLSLDDFALEDDGVAELFGLELARLVADGCFVAAADLR